MVYCPFLIGVAVLSMREALSTIGSKGGEPRVDFDNDLGATTRMFQGFGFNKNRPKTNNPAEAGLFKGS